VLSLGLILGVALLAAADIRDNIALRDLLEKARCEGAREPAHHTVMVQIVTGDHKVVTGSAFRALAEGNQLGFGKQAHIRHRFICPILTVGRCFEQGNECPPKLPALSFCLNELALRTCCACMRDRHEEEWPRCITLRKKWETAMEEIGYREGEERDDEVGSAVEESMYSVEINSWDELDIPKGYEIDDEGDRDEFHIFQSEKLCKKHLREKYADKRALVDDFLSTSRLSLNPFDEKWEMLDCVEAAFEKWLKR